MLKLKSLPVLAIAAVFLLPSQSMAETETSVTDKQYALVFLLSSITSAPQAYGTLFSSGDPVPGMGLKYRINNTLHARVGLGFITTSTTQGELETTNRASFLEAGVEAHLIQSGPLSGYAGGTFVFLGSGQDSTRDNTTTSSTATAIGLSGMVGAEYEITPNFTLSAEYRLTLVNEKQTGQDDDVSTTAIVLGAGQVGFLASFWF